MTQTWKSSPVLVFAGLATGVVHSEGQVAFLFVILLVKLNFVVGNTKKQGFVNMDFVKTATSYFNFLNII